MSLHPRPAHVAYLWIAQRDVDGQPNVRPRYTATNSSNTPLAGAELLQPGGEVTAWTVRKWHLLGTAQATALVDANNEKHLRMWTPLQYGVDVSIAEAVTHGWFTKA